MRVVMTGSGGFIGAHVLARMVGAGVDVTLLGPDTGRSRYTASLVSAGTVRLLRCDSAFLDGDVLRPVLAEADALVLLGYVKPESRSPAQHLLDEFRYNLTPLLRLLASAEEGVRHVVFASSISVYGSPERAPVSESDPPRPRTPHAIAKLASEHALRVWATTCGASASILRYSTVYGPSETAPRAIPTFIRAALSGESPIIDGDGLDEYDYVHVADVAEATLAALQHKADGTYNIGTGIGTTTLELAKLVIALTGATATPVLCPTRSSDHVRTRLFCDTERARATLGFAARHSLADGIREEAGWFKSQLAGAPRALLAATA
jgi:UDP-glucose 4-epimerase